MIFKHRNDNTWKGTYKLKGESESGTINIICRCFLAQSLARFHVLYCSKAACCKIISSWEHRRALKIWSRFYECRPIFTWPTLKQRREPAVVPWGPIAISFQILSDKVGVLCKRSFETNPWASPSHWPLPPNAFTEILEQLWKVVNSSHINGWQRAERCPAR